MFQSLKTITASALLLLAWAGSAWADVATFPRTAREQALLLPIHQVLDGQGRVTQNRYLAEIEKTICNANVCSPGESLRQPVSRRQLRRLQLRLATRGLWVPMQELMSATDYAHALMREGLGRVSLAEKVSKLPGQLRKAFHGNVAEFPEARDRNMVLTQNTRSRMWDLTEAKSRPRNYQMKIYARPGKAIDSIIADLDTRLDFTKSGILPQETLDYGIRTGRLERTGEVYRPVGRTDITLESSRVYRAAESTLYARDGRQSLLRRGTLMRTSYAGASMQFQTSGKWLGRIGVAALIATEGTLIQGYATGRLSRREFVTAQAGTGGAVAGAWVGVPIGMAIANAPGAIVGGLAGAVFGGVAGDLAATRYFERLDLKQKRQVEDFVYAHYGVTS